MSPLHAPSAALPHSHAPLRRFDVHVESAGDELAIHDPEHGHFHTLNATAASVWLACDGLVETDQIAASLDLPLVSVELALSQLAEAGLLASIQPAGFVTRREALRQLAAAGLIGAVLLPAIASITKIDVANAATCCPAGRFCIPDSTCNKCCAGSFPVGGGMYICLGGAPTDNFVCD